MIHYIKQVFSTISLCLMLFAAPVHAADEDIDIPYTDTYGYVYDPATGSFIKQDQPVAGTDGSAVSPAAVTVPEPAVSPEPASSVMAAAEPENTAVADTGPRFSLLLAMILLMAAGFTTYRLIARKTLKPSPNKD